MKGCPLRCVWCHNPEGIGSRPVLSFMPDKCIGCGHCAEVCPRGAHVLADGRHSLLRDRCAACGLCAEKCYAVALEIVGREMTVQEVIEEVLKDQPFYETSGGGMTLSGGEPLFQIDFTVALLQAARRARLHCCMETCGSADFEALRRTIPLVDLFLYDVKDTDERRHAANTGAGVRRILDNLRRLHEAGARIRLRLPLVPGCNDAEDNFRGIAGLVSQLPGLEGVEVMPYHDLGTSKRDRLGLPRPPGARIGMADRPQISTWLARLEQLGVPVLNEKS